MKVLFSEIENWEADYIKRQIGNQAELFFNEQKIIKSNLPEQKDFDAISVFVGSKIDKEVIDNFPNLKLITTRSTGFDHIDLDYAKQKGIQVGYVPGYGDNTVAEYAFGLLLALSRKIYDGVDRIKETENFNFDGLRGFDLKGKTMGVLGTGRIGQHTIKIANGFGMNVIAYDAFQKEELAQSLNFKYVSLDELLGQADVISIHLPYIAPSTISGQASTHHLINKDNISKIKKGAILINTARGAIVETDALVQALQQGILGGAGLDVLEEEGVLQVERGMAFRDSLRSADMKTVLEDHVLMQMPNVLITPHNAFNTVEALKRILDTDINNIKFYLSKSQVSFPVPAK